VYHRNTEAKLLFFILWAGKDPMQSILQLWVVLSIKAMDLEEQ